jgi:hypothetical protein
VNKITTLTDLIEALLEIENNHEGLSPVYVDIGDEFLEINLVEFIELGNGDKFVSLNCEADY